MITALSDKLQAYLLPVANKIAKNRYLQANSPRNLSLYVLIFSA